MKKEFNLSEKFQFGEEFATGERFYLEEDVKEFIKRLKEDFVKNFQDACAYQLLHRKNDEEAYDLMNDWFCHKIDKLAGEELC